MPNRNKNRIGILILESENASASSLNISTPDLPCEFKKVGSTESMYRELKASDYALALLNMNSTGEQITSAVKKIKHLSPETQIIAVFENEQRKLGESAVAAGADDCIFKPLTGNILINRIKNICEMVTTKNELMRLRQEIAMSYGFDNFVGQSAGIQRIKRAVQGVTFNDTVVVLSGENGTGKNLLAKIVHYHSPRRKNPFLKLDCSALTASQIETELFGIAQSATSDKTPGSLLKRAASGTVFIDKLHLLEQSVLAKVQKELHRHLRGNTAAFRLIVSVNEPLYDLYSRGVIDRKLTEGLDAVEISLPPLRNRLEDINQLASYFLRLISFENGAGSISIGSSVLEFLKSYAWPGNVRELENSIRRAVLVCNHDCIEMTDVSFISGANVASAGPNRMHTTKQSLVESQRQLIERTLDDNQWNFTQVAKQLGIGRTTLWRKIRKFNLKKETDNRLETMGVTTNDD
ncbi:MAG TPA: sigma 54-interacting transcriptional regulator [candidate division Zixibacteria bacterium]|nr:sigma 54-interacting transcriptional regulator [candidate division Zixibacteria bacterium]